VTSFQAPTATVIQNACIEFFDTDGDRMKFVVRDGHMDVHCKKKHAPSMQLCLWVKSVASLRVDGYTIHYSGVAVGASSGNRVSSVPNNSDGREILQKVQAMFVARGQGQENLNDEGAPVRPGRDVGHENKYYCGRNLGVRAIPGSDGRCGPSNGPQCASCKRFAARGQGQENLNDEGAPVRPGRDVGCQNKYYCGRNLGERAIPGSDGRCGPSNGPQCASCKRFQGARGGYMT